MTKKKIEKLLQIVNSKLKEQYPTVRRDLDIEDVEMRLKEGPKWLYVGFIYWYGDKFGTGRDSLQQSAITLSNPEVDDKFTLNFHGGGKDKLGEIDLTDELNEIWKEC